LTAEEIDSIETQTEFVKIPFFPSFYQGLLINQTILSSKGDMHDIQVELKPDNDDPNLTDVKKLKKAKSSDIVKELNRIVTKFKKRGLTEYNDMKFIS
tara:strand:- start:554 stop:847 length:294 start_codon:yes stop_codon:yes gene_type:complete